MRTTHQDVGRTFAINGLTKEGANQMPVEFEGSPTNVADYFARYARVIRSKGLEVGLCWSKKLV